MKMYFIIGVAVLPFAMGITNSLARGPAGQPSQAVFLDQFDTDGNGLVTRQEIEVARADEFASADTNGDETLSYAELQAFEELRKAQRLSSEFDSLDQDDSGGISEDEFVDGHPQDRAASAAVVFLAADSDASGSVSMEELEVLKQMGPTPWMFSDLDQDADGGVSEEEYLSVGQPPQRVRSIRF